MYICAQCAQPPAHHKANNSKALQGIPAQPAAQLTIIKLRTNCAYRAAYPLRLQPDDIPLHGHHNHSGIAQLP